MFTEIFDPLGVTAVEVAKRLGSDTFCYFNASAVQPETSLSCGFFCCYWINVRLFNSDRPFEVVLNSYLTENPIKNQAIVEEYIETGSFFEEE